MSPNEKHCTISTFARFRFHNFCGLRGAHVGGILDVIMQIYPPAKGGSNQGLRVILKTHKVPKMW